MAEFSKLVITTKGQALLAKMIAGESDVEFTKVASSSQKYDVGDLESLTALENIEQESKISRITRTNEVAVKIEAAFTNTDLTVGYYMNALGLYATDPDEGEILYAATAETSGNCYMPAYNGITVSGAYIQLVTTVGNAENVSLEVDPAAVATIGDIIELREQVENLEELVAELQGWIGYEGQDDVLGVEVDFSNGIFTRLAAAVGKEGGADFDEYNAFGGRKRCIVADDGTVLAYYGDAAYTTSGALTQAVTVNGTTYAVGTACQVMVEQPKFYYKVIPMVLDGQHLRKARYYVSDNPVNHFKLHPAFIENGRENDKIYLAAYEGCLYHNNAYVLDDSQVLNTTSDKLSSISGAKPASGETSSQNLYRSATRMVSQNRGAGWEQSYAATVAASQILMLVEYGTTNMQEAIGDGIVHFTDDGSTNMAVNTGGTDSLGNTTGAVAYDDSGDCYVSYRGEENFFGNIWTWVDGINNKCPDDWTSSGAPTTQYSEIYVADHDFADDTDEVPYEHTGIHAAWANGNYASAFGYSEKFDWMFIPSEYKGDSALPISDASWNYNSGWLVARIGALWYHGSHAGAFSWSLSDSSSSRYRYIGGRLVYIPSKAS